MSRRLHEWSAEAEVEVFRGLVVSGGFFRNEVNKI